MGRDGRCRRFQRGRRVDFARHGQLLGGGTRLAARLRDETSQKPEDRDADKVARGLSQGHSFNDEHLCLIEITGNPVQGAKGQRCPAPRRRRLIGAHRQQPLQPVDPLANLPPHHPVAKDLAPQPQPNSGLSRHDSPGKDGANVGPFRLERLPPAIGPRHETILTLDHVENIRCMEAPHRCFFATRRQTFQAKLPDCLQHAEPHRPVRQIVSCEQTLGNKTRDQVERRRGAAALGG